MNQQEPHESNEPHDPQAPQIRDDGRGMAVAALILGVLGLICSCVPIGGLPLSAIAIVLGAMGKRRGQDGMATAGIVLGIIGVVLAIIAMFVGGYQAYVDSQETTAMIFH